MDWLTASSWSLALLHTEGLFSPGDQRYVDVLGPYRHSVSPIILIEKVLNFQVRILGEITIMFEL